MEDELRQIYEQRFHRINVGLLIAGLVAGLAVLLLADTSSPWFAPSLMLLIIPLAAWVIRRASEFVVAAGVLVLSLLGLVTFSLVRAGTLNNFTPYLFIPVVISAALLFSPVATAITAAAAIGLTLAVAALTGQLSLASFMLLLPLFLITILVTLLAIEGLRTTPLLGDRLAENRDLLRQRTLELLKALQELDQLGEIASLLQQQLTRALAESNRAVEAENMPLYSLVTGALQELDESMKNLRQVIEQLSQGPQGEHRAPLMEAAWQKMHRVSRLLINLDEMVQLVAGRVQLDCQPVEPVRLLQEVTGIARGLVGGKPVEVMYRGTDELPAVPVDVVRLRQALLQVLTNAVKYTDQGQVEVQAEITNGELLIYVADTGIGMYPEERQSVFEQFGRGQGTLAQQRQGTGLGLSISKALIELHGGRMWATSALGVGSTFYIAIPLEAPEAATMISPPLRFPKGSTLPSLTAELLDLAVIQRLPPRPPLSGRSTFGPVSRLSQSYVNRFAIAAIILLLLLGTTIGALAFSRGPVEDNQAANETPLAARDVRTPVSTQSALLPGTSTPAAASPLPEPVTVTPSAIFATQPAAVTAGQATRSAAPAVTPTASPAAVTLTLTPAPPAIPTASATALPAAASAPSVAGLEALAGPRPDLAYVVEEAGGPQVVLAGSNLNLPLAQPGVGLSWSPDGRRVAFAAIENGYLDLYVMDAGCAGPDEICEEGAINLTRSPGDDLQPAWSPDGRLLVFSSGRNGNFDLYLLDIACLARPEGCAGSERQLTASQGYEEWPAWSPDGGQLAFVSDVEGNVELYTINTDGSNQQRITDHPAADWPVTWSPDGRWLLFASDRDGHWNLYLVRAGCAGTATPCAGQTYRLTNDPADERDPVWSPDGRVIAFASNREGNWDIYTIPAPGPRPGEVAASAWTRITATRVDERYPAWLP